MQSANDALEVSLVVPGVAGTKPIAKFHPQFTYPVFGDDEQIFGYRDLRINVAFNATDMRPNLNISYGKKFKTVGETEAVDIEGILREFLPEGQPGSFNVPYELCHYSMRLTTCSCLSEKERVRSCRWTDPQRLVTTRHPSRDNRGEEGVIRSLEG